MEAIYLKSHSFLVQEPRSRTHFLSPSQMLLLTALKAHQRLFESQCRFTGLSAKGDLGPDTGARHSEGWDLLVISGTYMWL